MELKTLDEAIKHSEEVAEEKEIDIENQNPLFPNNIEECKKCAAEHRQLAEWLKDYKRLLEQEPCEDAISRKKVIDTIYHECSGKNLDIDFAKVLLLQRKIKALPPVRPEPKAGHWIHHKETFDCAEHWECSQCHRTTMTNPFIVQGNDYNAMFLCHKCGAKMAESEEEE